MALALTAAWLAYRRRFPIKIAAASIAVVLPWAVFALFYYGSPVPHSFGAKLYLQSVTKTFDHFWIASFLIGDFRFLFAAATVILLALLRSARFGGTANERLAASALGMWFLFHFSAFSVMSLGDYYPWYLTALIPPSIILGCTLGRRLFTLCAETRFKVPSAVGLAFLLWLTGKGAAGATWKDFRAGNSVKRWEAFDDDRRLTGIFLSQYARPDEIVSSAYGWPAFESRMRVNDVSLLNSVQMLDPVMYMVEAGVPAEAGSHAPATPGGFVPLATFNLASDLFPGYSWFTVFGRPGSSIARHGVRYLQYRLFELPAPTAYSANRGLEHIQLAGMDLLAHPPSGATFSVENGHQTVHVVFAPGFAPAVPADKTDGVTFELLGRDGVLYSRHGLPTEREEPVVVQVPDARSRAHVEISLLTGPGPKGDPTYDWAIWKSVKIVVGDAFIDPSRLRNKKVMQAWARYNPT